LQKNPQTILNAYNDSQGITKAFNLNLLHRINRELKADFDTHAFLHYPVYDIEQSCAKSYLVSTKVQTVHIKELNLKVDFEAWEAIYMEVSNKYSFQLIAQMAQATSFEVVENFTDEKQYFADSLWRVS
jgi:L-histidine Nalpha-methyltransferase